MMRREYLTDRLRSPLTCDWPNFADLEAERVTVDELKLRRIESIVGKFRHCVLTGAEGRGKTSLARVFGYSQLQVGRTMFHVDMAEPGGETIEQLCYSIRHLDHAQPIYIIENVHEVDDQNELAGLLRATVATTSSHFLYTTKSGARDALFRELDLSLGGRSVTSDALEVKVEPTTGLIRAIVAKHVRSNASLALPENSEYPAILVKCGLNLRTLSSYLEVWGAGRFSDIPESEMLSVLYSRRLASLQPTVCVVLVGISTVAQFGIPALGEVFGSSEAERLAQARIVNRHYVGMHAFYSLPHPTDASTNVAAWAVVQGQDPGAITRECLLRYLRFEPLPSNSPTLLQRLRVRRTLLRELLQDDGVRRLFVASFRTAMPAAPLSYIRRSLELAREAADVAGQLANLVVERGPSFLADKIRGAGEEDASWALREFSRISASYGAALRGLLTAADWHDIWLRTPVPQLIRFLHRYAVDPSVHDHTAMAQSVLADLVGSADFPAGLRRLSYELIGKLLVLCRRIGGDACRIVGTVVVDHIDLSGCREPGRLTLILKELWQLGAGDARDKLLLRILEEVPLEVFIEETSGRGLAFLCLGLAHVSPDVVPRDRSQYVLRTALSSDIGQRLGGWDPVALQTLLWAGLLVDRDEIRRWVGGLETGPIGELLLQTDSPSGMFTTLWNALQADRGSAEAIAGGIVLATKQRFWAGSRQAEIETLPLLGLLGFVVPRLAIESLLPEPSVAAARLCKVPSASGLAFALRAYERFSPERATAFAESTAVALRAKGLSFGELFTSHPVAAGREVLRDIIAPFPGGLGGGPRGPNGQSGP